MKLFCTCYLKLRNAGLTLCVLSIAIGTHAQKAVQFSQFYFNQLYFNPATAGKGNENRVAVAYRSQYTGYQPTFADKGGGQTSQLVSASLSFGKLGIGVYALNDTEAATGQQDIQLSAAYKFSLSKGVLSIGARGGLYRQSLDYDKLRPVEPDVDDPLFLTGTESGMKPDVSLGVHYESTTFYAGASAAHLSKPRFGIGGQDAQLSTVYYLNTGAYLSLGYMLEIQPMLLAKFIPGVISAEGGALVTYDQRFFGGVTYRHQDAIAIVHAGANLLADQSLRLSAAYDVVMGGNRSKAPGSVEVMLSYAFGRHKSGGKSIIRTPRFRY
jgi:type IX secretion system PorP/SprF family membrane protein